jgi:single-strand DNA-binding protein
MAYSLNKVQLIGNVGQDPEVRSGQDGFKVVTFSMATTESWKDKASGERRDKTEWHRIAVFNERLADIVERFVKKGSKLYVEGQLQTRKWTDQSGQERYTTEIVMGRFNGELILLSAKDEMLPSSSPSYSPASSSPASPQKVFLDDDLPF